MAIYFYTFVSNVLKYVILYKHTFYKQSIDAVTVYLVRVVKCVDTFLLFLL